MSEYKELKYEMEQNPRPVIEEAICLMMERWAEARAGDFDNEDFEEIRISIEEEFSKKGGLFDRMIDSAASKVHEWIA